MGISRRSAVAVVAAPVVAAALVGTTRRDAVAVVAAALGVAAFVGISRRDDVAVFAAALVGITGCSPVAVVDFGKRSFWIFGYGK